MAHDIARIYLRCLRSPRDSGCERRATNSERRSGNDVSHPCPVLPASSSSACGSRSITASSDSTAPAGLPGRFTIKLVPRIPHTPRLSAANRVLRIPSARICSAIPSTMRSHTAQGRLWRYISRSNSRPARRHHQPGGPAQSDQFFLDGAAFIRQHGALNDLKSAPLQCLSYRRTGEVRLLAA